MSTAEKTRYTPEDLMAMTDSDGYELVEGHLLERKMGAWSSWVSGQIFFLLRIFCQGNRTGLVFPSDTAYRCFGHAPNTVRKPDVSFIRQGRLSDESPPRS